MFRGINSINLDAKGRMAVPVRYREQIVERCSGNLVVTIDTQERCLLLYPVDEWDVIQAKIDALPNCNQAVRRLQRLFVGHATDVVMDSSGRLLLSASLRTYANLNKDIVLLGLGRKFEIWDAVHWQHTRDQYLCTEYSNDVLPDELQMLAL